MLDGLHCPIRETLQWSSRSPKTRADKFFSQFEETLENETDIMASQSEISIVRKNLDEISTKEEICETLEKEPGKFTMNHKP